MAFTVSSFRFEFRARTDILLPEFSGSTFRGGFGTAFKRTVCIYKPAVCEHCPYQEKCAYLYIFETPVEKISNPDIVKGHAPHPFVLEPDIQASNQITEGKYFYLTLNLIGQGLEYLPFFVFTFVRLGRMGLGKGRGNFDVMNVYSINGEEKEIYSIESGKLKKTYHNLFWEGLENEPDLRGERSQMIIEYETPTRISYQGKILREIPFSILITNLLRRIRLLDVVHGDGKMEYDHKRWIALAREVETRKSHLFWNDWKRYSHRQKNKIFMGGVEGKVTYFGPLQPFVELLQIGEKLHVGKGTAFGLGKYRLIR